MKRSGKETLYALMAAVVLHAGGVVWLQASAPRVIEVPFVSDQFSTRVSMGEEARHVETPKQELPKAPPPSIKPKNLPKPITTQSRPVAQAATAAPNAPAPDASPAQDQAASQATQGESGEGGRRGHEGSPHRAKDDLQKYIRKVSRIIDSKKRYPRISQQNGEEGVVSIQLVLDSSGNLLGYIVLQKTEFERLHQAAVETVKAASPFPPLPESYDKPQLIIQVPVRFRMDQG